MDFDCLEFALDTLRMPKKIFWEKYYHKIPKHIKIEDIIHALFLAKKEYDLIDIDDKNYLDSANTMEFLIKKDEHYEVFFWERDEKMFLQKFENLRVALFHKFDAIFNALAHQAPDSIINAKK